MLVLRITFSFIQMLCLQVIAPLDLCPQNSYGSDDATTSCARTVDNNVEAEQKVRMYDPDLVG